MVATIDLTSNMGVQLDQSPWGACGPNTVAELDQFDERVQGLPMKLTSRLHHYWWTRYLMGTTSTDSGVDNRSMLKAAAKYGLCSDESLWPYIDANFFQKPSAEANQAALANLIGDYAAVIQSLEQMKGCLANGRPFLFGFDVYDQIMSDEAAATGLVRDPAMFASPIGGHDVSLCGYTDVEMPGIKPGNKWPAGTFRFRNHWMNSATEPWGDGGYGYISYAYTVGPHAGDFWVINSVPGSPPQPAPVPPIPGPPVPPIPGPSPLPIPPIGPSLLAEVNAFFTAMEAKYAAHPLIVWVLKLVQGFVVSVIPTNTFRSMGKIPVSVVSVIDAAFQAASVAYPAYAGIIMLVKGLFDSYFGS